MERIPITGWKLLQISITSKSAFITYTQKMHPFKNTFSYDLKQRIRGMTNICAVQRLEVCDKKKATDSLLVRKL